MRLVLCQRHTLACPKQACSLLPRAPSTAFHAWVARRGVNIVPNSSSSSVQVRHAPTRVWRPQRDDVDKLSRGEAARTRGTGSRMIPHRLNVYEHELFKTAKRKGFLAVRGTAYRKERKGHPLPNIFRQWCDANSLPCVIIEQDASGGSLDVVVVDLSTLRLLDSDKHAEVIQVCSQLAVSLEHVRHVGPDECNEAQVPFNVLSAELPGSRIPRNVIKTNIPNTTALMDNTHNMQHQHKNAVSETTMESGEMPTLVERNTSISRIDSNQTSTSSSTSSGSSSRDTSLPVSADSVSEDDGSLQGVEQLMVEAAELEQQLEQQRVAVRTLKESGGKGNGDPEVKAQVEVLLKLKVEAASAQDKVLAARANLILQQQQAGSARRAAMLTAFAEDQASEEMLGTDTPLHEDCSTNSDSFHEAESSHNNAQQEFRHHPYCTAATWQLHPEPIFFEADRANAKSFAKAVLVRMKTCVNS